MSSWTAGYVSEVAYTHGYYRELSPNLIDFALLCSQQRHRSGRPRRYLELGFGQGVSLAIHAAACSGEFWGTDFNPVHASNARDLAESIGATVRIFDDSFGEFAKREDLPEFDVITLHGIWSWINDDNRRILVDLIRRRLAVGGVVYVSYNVTPGWSMAMPLRHLMSLHVETATEKSRPITDRIDSALDFAKAVANAGSSFFRQNPSLVHRLDSMKGQDHAYLAHEYFNADWHPMAFSEAHEFLQEAKLSYAGSAYLPDQIHSINLTADARKMLAGLSNPVLRETVRDYFTGSQFRRDLWVKGARPIDSFEQNQKLFEMRFTLVSALKNLPTSVQTPMGQAGLQKEIYEPLGAAMAEDGYKPKTMQQLCDRLPGIEKPALYQALLILCGYGHAAPCQCEAEVEANAEKCRRFNSHLLREAYFNSTPAYLASPVIGAGIMLPKASLWVLREMQAGVADTERMVESIWANLASRNQRMARDGQALDTPEANKAEIRQLITTMDADTLPLLRSLRLI
jgi:predicted O-methyltransferase YrrM